jgi:hypothetical protein
MFSLREMNYSLLHPLQLKRKLKPVLSRVNPLL